MLLKFMRVIYNDCRYLNQSLYKRLNAYCLQYCYTEINNYKSSLMILLIIYLGFGRIIPIIASCQLGRISMEINVSTY